MRRPYHDASTTCAKLVTMPCALASRVRSQDPRLCKRRRVLDGPPRQVAQSQRDQMTARNFITTWRFESVRDGSPLSLSDRRRLCVGHCSATLRRLSFQMYRESGRPLRRVSRKQMLDAAKRGETRTWILSPRAILSWECRAALRHARHFMMQEPLPPCQPQLLL